MNKAERCLLHLRCIARKGMCSEGSQWHWQHLLRELGCGVYSRAAQESSTHKDRQCYT
jgi:hypothetical protein